MRENADRSEIAEASLRHIKKIDVVGQLTGGIAHDFNNLLAVIIGNIELILRKPEDRTRVARVSRGALQAAERGQRLIEQLLMFSRRQVMRPVTLNLNRVLLEFETLMRHAAGAPAELQLKLDPALDISNIDRAQFEAAVLNLVVNARDALPSGGRIIIETANVDLDESYTELNPDVVPGAYAMVAVSDNGVGIGASALPHVFEPFFTTKEVGRDRVSVFHRFTALPRNRAATSASTAKSAAAPRSSCMCPNPLKHTGMPISGPSSLEKRQVGMRRSLWLRTTTLCSERQQKRLRILVTRYSWPIMDARPFRS